MRLAIRGLHAKYYRRFVGDVSFDGVDPLVVDRFVQSVEDSDRTAALEKLDMIMEHEAGVLHPADAGAPFGARKPLRWLAQGFVESVGSDARLDVENGSLQSVGCTE